MQRNVGPPDGCSWYIRILEGAGKISGGRSAQLNINIGLVTVGKLDDVGIIPGKHIIRTGVRSLVPLTLVRRLMGECLHLVPSGRQGDFKTPTVVILRVCPCNRLIPKIVISREYPNLHESVIDRFLPVTR